MENSILAYRNRAAEATLAGGNWESALPLDNLKDRSLSKAAVCASVNAADTQFTITSPQSRLVRVFGLLAHNMGTQDALRVRGYADVAETDLLFDSGRTDVWPMIYEFGDVDWNDDSFWSLTISEEDREEFNWDCILVLSQAIYVRRWRVEIFKSDATPPAIGMLWISDGWQTKNGASWNRSRQYVDPSEIDSAPLSGAEYADERPKYRIEKFAFDWLSNSEAARAQDLQRIVGTTQDVLYLHDPSDTANATRRWFLGRIQEPDPIVEPYVNKNTTTYTIKERIE